MFSETRCEANSLATVANKRVFRSNREDDPDGFIAYVKGWASVGSPGEQAKVFYFRDHLGGEAQVWAEAVPWETGFEALCEAFLRRFKGRMSSIAHIKTLAKETYREGSFLSYLDRMRSISLKAGLPEIVLITFVLNGLPDDVGGTLLMNTQESLSWEYVYRACEGLDCSNRADPGVVGRKEPVVAAAQGQMEICAVSKKESVCFYCKKPGHFKRECRKRARDREEAAATKAVAVEEEGQDEIKSFTGYTEVLYISLTGKEGVQLLVRVGGVSVKALVDTGSTVNLIRSKYVKGEIRPCKVILRAANGTGLIVRGKVTVDVGAQGRRFKVEFLVVDKMTEEVILGRTFCALAKVQIDFSRSKAIVLGGQEDQTYALGEHAIVAEAPYPIAAGLYRLGPEKEDAASVIVKKYLKEGIIRESHSPWRSPIVMKRKKSGEYRLCVDYRSLNDVTVKDKYPIPRVDDVLDALGEAKIFTKLDALSGYHQIKMREEDIEKTAFACREGLFEFLRMPFGLVNGPATFQRAMNRILRPFLGRFVMVYMDDMIIYSRDKREHEGHVREVLDALKQAGLKLNEEKCAYFQDEIKILGHVVGRHGIRADPDRVKAIRDLELPTCRTEVESFLGLINYVSRFMKSVTEDTGYFYDLLKKDSKFDWGSSVDNAEFVEAFHRVKANMDDLAVMGIPRREGKFILTTDASDRGIGAIFSQVQDGKERILEFFGKAHTKAEKNYSTTEKELLGVVKSLERFRPYLLGNRFTLKTDHSAIKWLYTSRNMKSRLARWSLLVQEYDMEIIHIRGDKNPSDYLSRMAFKEEEVASVRGGEAISLEEVHEELGHGSAKAMGHHLKEAGKLVPTKDIKGVIDGCEVCQQSGGGAKSFRPVAVRTQAVNDLWEFDLVGPLPRSRQGYVYLLTGVDHFSRGAVVRPLRTKEAGEVLYWIGKLVKEMGPPKVILTDNGKEFANRRAAELASENDITWRYGAPYSPTTTGLVERFNRTFIEKLRKVSRFGERDWVECLGPCMKAYRNSYHRALGCTPEEFLTRIRRTGQRRKLLEHRSRYDKVRGKEPSGLRLVKGDRVWYQHPVEQGHKLAAAYRWRGEVVDSKFGSATVKLEDGRVIRAALRYIKRF
uniref:RNA-directed DNA polymerase n=1 Tax=Nosema bombycis TaxID=27978 RepID=Q15F60_NOSBO|nr:pol polyprotein [Nosema bombycis]